MNTAVSARSLSVAPWGEPVLTRVDLELAAGEICGIIGPNGAGKSTLLHALAGGVTSTGELDWWGQRAADWSLQERARMIAVLPQASTLSFPFSVAEVVLFGRGPHRSGAAADRRILEEVLAGTDTTHLAGRAYTALSGGERQRVQLARVLAQVWRAEDAVGRLLLLDEPTNALDLAHQHLVMERLRELREGGCAVCMVMHDLNLMAAVADQVIVLKEGCVHASGQLAAVLTANLFDEVFGVSMQVTAHPRHGYPVVNHP